jgi:predicted cupin superfamily sugar epimerase
MKPPLAAALDLQPHPEGGWYRQTWRAVSPALTADGRDRATATLILFLLPAGESSAWHRVASEEIWLAHHGAVALELGGDGPSPVPGVIEMVGVDLTAGQRLQVVVSAGVWQRTLRSDADALVSCVVSPGFDFDDFELAPDVTGA